MTTQTTSTNQFTLYKGLNYEGDPIYGTAEITQNRQGLYSVKLEYHDNDFLDAMGVQSIGQIKEQTPERIEAALLKTGYIKK